MKSNFGLPEDVKFCNECVISNQRPVTLVETKHSNKEKKKSTNFDENGICDACNWSKIKETKINWEKRDNELSKLLDFHRSRKGNYDVVVPASGGKDSIYVAHILKHKYKMHPLTVTWAPHIYTDWGWQNFQKWIHSGFDNFLFTPNKRVK